MKKIVRGILVSALVVGFVGGPAAVADIKSDDVNAALKKLQDKKAGTGALIGAAAGVAAGGIATGITAWIESSTISCNVGNGLDTVGFGKTGKIDTLKNYYVKWALHLPDILYADGGAVANTCTEWDYVCRKMTRAKDCTKAVVNYRKAGSLMQVYGGCEMSGSNCVGSTVQKITYSCITPCTSFAPNTPTNCTPLCGTPGAPTLGCSTLCTAPNTPAGCI